jgi:hypothetical protein
MRRILCLLALVAVMLAGLVAGNSEAAGPLCEYAQVQSPWVRVCAGLYFSSIGCDTVTYSDAQDGLYAQVQICYPESV